MSQDALMGAASGASAGAAFGPWGIAIGGAIGLAGGILSSNAKKKSYQAQAEALRRRQAEIRGRAEINANSVLTQGELSMGQWSVDRASRGFAFSSTDEDTLSIISQRAQLEAALIRRDAEFEAMNAGLEASQYDRQARAESTASILGTASSAISLYGKFSESSPKSVDAPRKISRSPAIV